MYVYIYIYIYTYTYIHMYLLKKTNSVVLGHCPAAATELGSPFRFFRARKDRGTDSVHLGRLVPSGEETRRMTASDLRSRFRV